MTLAEHPQSDIHSIGEPPTYYQVPLTADKTHQLVLMTASHGWLVRSQTMKKCLDFKNKEFLTEIRPHEILSAHLYAGEIYVYVKHDVFQKAHFRPWERELFSSFDMKFRNACNVFNLTPEELVWPETFTPSYVSKPDWKEPVAVEWISLEQQAVKFAEAIRRIKGLELHFQKEHPDYAYLIRGPLFEAQRDLKNFLAFDKISTFTDPAQIPAWAWKSSYGYQCKKRRQKELWKKYAAEGLIEE